jgi:hypothetical protein
MIAQTENIAGLGKFAISANLRRWIKRACDFMPYPADVIISALVELIPEGRLVNGIEYEPTAFENTILEEFSRKIAGFITLINNDFEKALLINDFNGQMYAFNDIAGRIAYVRWFYLTNDTKGLSQNAIDLRSDLIEALTDTIFTRIETTFKTNNVAVERYETNAVIQKTKYAFLPLPIVILTPVTMAASQFRLKSDGIITPTPTPVIVVTNPPPPPPPTGTSTELGTQTENTPLASKGDATLMVIGAGALALLFLFGRKSKK